MGDGEYRILVGRADRVKAGLVVQLVALANDLTPEAVLDVRRREPEVRLARRTAFYLAHVTYGWSLERVGHAMGRNRVTVGAACKRVEDERDDPEADARIERLGEALETALRAAGART
ncbi:helix-turn-helix domain-containing protein [Brevundimonas balnearis]|uniref:Helix-turn-helix domain-containing protein n=1 Tax=Brevundimonas balnearis TaxID=1572858 RepID=A0ABV6R5F0_9CAUL